MAWHLAYFKQCALNRYIKLSTRHITIKSKKFNAAEKHFQKKEEKLLSELHQARIAERKALAERDQIQQECDRLKIINSQLKKANKTLQDIVHLSDSDLQTLVRRSKSVEQWLKLQGFMAHMNGE